VLARVRSEVARARFVTEHGREPATARELSDALARYSRPRQMAVAGYDLTFSPVKSVSALWAVAPADVARAIEEAHDAAVGDALAFIEREVLFTREGRNGARQVETRGLIGTAFTHRGSRAGDPDLHTHVAVANKVQTASGKWLSIYGKVLHEHVVAASETYNTALERHLVETLGVTFVERPAGARGKRPVREIEGVSAELCERWSQRRTRYGEALHAWQERIVVYVGHRDEQTGQLAKYLDGLQRKGVDAERMLELAVARKPLPIDHPTAALAG
jgi:conjugative relaxase-like TrwC/TraI family protein